MDATERSEMDEHSNTGDESNGREFGRNAPPTLPMPAFNSSMADELIHDIRTQILIHEAVAAEVTEHGQYYEIACPLAGPNGRILDIRTIWMREHLSGQIKFIPLIPSQKRENDH
jgi:hypothetical protein